MQQTALSKHEIQKILNGLDKGLRPVLLNLDKNTLSAEDRNAMIKQLDDLEELAKKIKNDLLGK